MQGNIVSILLWTGIVVVCYAYLGYGIILFGLVKVKRFLYPSPLSPKETQVKHKVTFIVCAFNESGWIAEKIKNSVGLYFPKNHIRFIFVTDGSTDDTPQRARATFEGIKDCPTWHILHQPERRGKIAAFHRAMLQYGKWDNVPDNHHIILSTDANTLLNSVAIEKIVTHFNDPNVGAVAGEKRIRMGEKDAANSAGEGIYWKYESLLKKWDAELWTVVGAAGELFAFRAEAYEAVPQDTLVEDFHLTMRIAQKGYRVAYEPYAYAVESSSASVSEEMKRKVRIAAGGLQAVVRLAPLLNFFKYGTVSFQYISHRVLRWTLAPLFLPIIFLTNAFLAFKGNTFYSALFILQIIFYTCALLGFVLERRQLKIKAFFVPYYFCLMNYAMYAGFFRLIRGKQSVIWEKSKRADEQ